MKNSNRKIIDRRELLSKTTGIVAGTIAFPHVLISATFGANDMDKRIKVLFLRGGGHAISNPVILKEAVLDKTNNFEITFSENLDDVKEQHIKQFDLVAVYTTGMSLSKEQESGLCDFVKNGGGFAGIHCASDSFKNSDRYHEMVGGRFAGHGSGKYTVHIYDHEHPITRGLKDFEIVDESYCHNYHRNAQMRSLTRINWTNNERQSMCWVSHYGKGRVFYTGNGHGAEAWSNPHFQRLVTRGMYWAVNRKAKSPSS